jgi:hypothetical protein
VRLIHQLINADAGVLVDEVAQVVDLPTGGFTSSYLRSVDTSALALGGYACVLKAEINGETKTLAFGGFQVLEPPIRLDATLKAGGKGRLLVLLDDPAKCDDESHHANGDDEHDSDDKESKTKRKLVRSDSESCVKNRDPHGPASAPSLTAQRAFLEALLTGAGWSYTITETADIFTKELRSGNYNTYAVLAEHEKLSEQAQKELREAAFRGEGLLVAGSHDARHYKVIDALGLKLIGSVPGAAGATLLPSPLDLSGEIPLLSGDKALRIKRTTAQALARYRLGGVPSDDEEVPDCRDLVPRYEAAERTRSSSDEGGNDNDECDGNPGAYLDAATLNNYGKGKTAFVGFDLLAAASVQGSSSLAANTLLAGLAWVQPATLPALTGTVLPLELVITNKGIATTTTTALALPAGVTVLDAGTGLIDGNNLVFTTTLAVGEEKVLRFWVKLPAIPGAVTFEATVSAGTPPTVKATASFSVTVEIRELGAVKTQLEALIAASHPNSKALKLALVDLNIAYKGFYPDKAIEFVLKATDALLGLTEPAVVNLRAALGEWVRYASVVAY